MVNKSKTKAYFISRSTRKDWFIRELFDKLEGTERVFYLCPKKLVKISIFNMSEGLKYDTENYAGSIAYRCVEDVVKILSFGAQKIWA